MQKRKTKLRSCSDCGKQERVRQDSPRLLCRECGFRRLQPNGRIAERPGYEQRSCQHCGASLSPTHQKFCSRECKHASWREEKQNPEPINPTSALTELEFGRAAELLVCAELILAGFPAYPSAAGLAYDIAVDMGDHLIRLQVKATRGPRPIPQRVVYTPAYAFNMRRCGRGGRGAYKPGQFDGYALIAVDRRLIAFLLFEECTAQTIFLRPPGHVPARNASRSETLADFPWSRFAAAWIAKRRSP